MWMCSPAEFASSRMRFAPRPRTRKMIGMLTVILSTTVLIMCGYLAVGLAGYVAYPLTVNSNALKSFPTHDLLMQVGHPHIRKDFFLWSIFSSLMNHSSRGMPVLWVMSWLCKGIAVLDQCSIKSKATACAAVHESLECHWAY